MRKRTRLALAALAAATLAVPAVVAAATSAYTTPTLRVTQTGTTTVIAGSVGTNDDATARAAIYLPTGINITTGQAPGTKLGSAKAQVSALDLAGALLPLTGDIVVPAPGTVAEATIAACAQGTPTAIWVLVLQAAGQTINLPAFLVPTAGAEAALGPAKLVICIGPPDVPAGTPGRATFGAKLLSAEITLTGVFSVVQTGAWIAVWTPWQAGTGMPNAAGTVASPAAVAPGAVSAAARKAGRKGVGAVVSGRVAQAGQPRGNATVTIYGGGRSLRRLGSVKAKANGSYSFRAASGTRFQARVVAAPGSAAPLCAALAGLPAPCVNPTVNGFTVRSATVTKR